MNPTAEQLLTAALALPNDDRLELAEALIVSVQPGDRPPFDESWREVIRRRSAELREGKVVPVPWSEVKELSVRRKVDEGIRELDAGQGIDHEEAKKRLSRWLD
ncbi:MAG: addiction module protein [Planctomycetes bacterium]|nr:addiction module protein [Planctomycetota bacterium]